MKLLVWICLAACSACAHAEWLTLVGAADDPASDYIQVDPSTVETSGDSRTVRLRVNRARSAPGFDGFLYRSFEGDVSVDCVKRTARYVRGMYYAAPNFVGEPIAHRTFTKLEEVPLRFQGFKGDYAGRVIRASCVQRAP